MGPQLCDTVGGWTDHHHHPSSADGCVQLVPKYIAKVKLDRGQSRNIFSEIIIPGENGGCGGNIPILHFGQTVTAYLIFVIFSPRAQFLA